MTLLYDKIAKVFTIPAPTTEITVQTLLNEIRTFEADQLNLDISQIASATGKEPLGGGVLVGITLTLLNNWRIAFAARSGPTWVQCRVTGGNLVGYAGAAVVLPTAFVQVIITASASITTLDIATAVWDESRTGHDLTGTFGATEEWASTTDPSDIANAVWDEISGGHQGAGTFGKAVIDTKNSSEFLEKHKTNRLLVKDNKLTLFDSDNVTPILSQSLFDQNEVPTVKNVYHRAKSNVIPGYLPPSFSAFAISGQISPLEVGAVIAANPTFVWGTINPENVEANSIALVDITGGAVITDHLPNTGLRATTYPAISKTSVASHSFRIDGTNTQSGPFSRSYSVSWLWRVYYGESVNAGPLGESDIEGLRVGNLMTSFAGTYSFLGGGYKYLCYPTALGKATSFIDPTTQFNIPFEDAVSVNVTNAFGVSIDYWVHRSTNILGGSISVMAS